MNGFKVQPDGNASPSACISVSSQVRCAGLQALLAMEENTPAGQAGRRMADRLRLGDEHRRALSFRSKAKAQAASYQVRPRLHTIQFLYGCSFVLEMLVSWQHAAAG